MPNDVSHWFSEARRVKQTKLAYMWVRSREHRHRQAHCLRLDRLLESYSPAQANFPSSLGFLQSGCGMLTVPVAHLLRYKEYPEMPERACRACEMWVRREVMRDLGE